MSDFDASLQYTDNVQLNDLSSQDSLLTVSASCELMNNQCTASPIEPNENLLVVQDSNGNPLLFSIGSDNILRLIKQTESSTGWETVNLLEGFGDVAAVAVDVSQDVNGNISIVVALNQVGEEATALYYASMISNEIDTVDWSTFSSMCTQLAGVEDGFVADQIILGTSDDNNSPLVVITGKLDNSELYYQSLDGVTAMKMSFPENVSADNMQALSLGYAFGQRGIWFLYKIGESQSLLCTTIANDDLGELNYDYSPGNSSLPQEYQNLSYNCIATPTGSGAGTMKITSDIYIGTDDGVYIFQGGKASSLQMITNKVSDVHEINVQDDGENLSIWVMCSPNLIYYIYGQRNGNDYQFNDPVLFDSSAIHIAPIRSRMSMTNELFVVSQDLNIVHHWQDPNSTLWREATISMNEVDYLINFNSYTIQVRLRDSIGNAMFSENLLVTASEWVYATINGLVYSIDADNPAKVPTDANGDVTIVLTASDMSAPVFHVESDRFAETLNIYPNGKVQKGLSTVQSGDDLKNATAQDGSAVVDSDSYDDSALDGTAQNISMLSSTANGMTEGSMADGALFLSLSVDNVKATGKVDASSLPDDFFIGLKSVGGRLSVLDKPVRIAPQSVMSGASSIAGDAWKQLENMGDAIIDSISDGVTVLKDGTSFVIQKVDDVLQFVLTTAEDLLVITLDTLPGVFKALGWILNLVGIDLAKLLAWLGFLFSWGDIWDTHKVIAQMTKNWISSIIDNLNTDALKSGTEALLGNIQNLSNEALEATLPSSTPQSDSVAVCSDGTGGGTSSPPSNWSNYQVMHAGLTDGGSSAGVADVGDFIQDILIPTADSIANALEGYMDEFIKVCSGDLDYSGLMKLCNELQATVMAPVENFLFSIFDYIPDILSGLESFLVKDLDIPFLSSFYKWVTKLFGDKEDLTLLNGFALIVAVPVTYSYKIAKGKAPFADGSLGLSDADLFNELSAGNRNSSLKSSSLGLQASSSDNTAATYSQVGGGIGSVAGFLNSAFGFGKAINGVAALPKLSPAQTGIILLAIKQACTVPMREDGQGQAPYGLKCGAFGVVCVQLVVNCILAWNPKDLSAKTSGGIVMFFNVLALILGMTADGLDEETDWHAWLADATGSVGGILVGGGTAFEDAYVAGFGAGLALSSSYAGMVEVYKANKNDIIQLVNVGGSN